MSPFGWFTVFVWACLGLAPGTDTWTAKIFCTFMVIGTLAWGTGSL